MFVFDIETLGSTERSVVLSAGIIAFDPVKDADCSFKELIHKGITIKFDADEQKQKYNRTTDQSTLEWWSRQCSAAQAASLVKSEHDMSAYAGVTLINNYIESNSKRNDVRVWTRGSFDYPIFSNLAKDVGIEFIPRFWDIRDIRSSIDVCVGNIYNGNGFGDNRININNKFDSRKVQHIPSHDCAVDILYLIEGWKNIYGE